MPRLKILLPALIVLTSSMFTRCKLYEKKPTTVELASSADKRVMIINSTNGTSRYKRIFIEGEELKALKKITISRDNINEVHLQDPVSSTIATVLTSLAIAYGSLFLLFAGSGGIGPGITLN